MGREITTQKKSQRVKHVPLSTNNGTNQSKKPTNLKGLIEELDWLAAVLEARLDEVYVPDTQPLETIPEPPASNSESPYGSFVIEHQLDKFDRLLLITALAPAVMPQLFNSRMINVERPYIPAHPGFGGWIDKHFVFFTPTVGTVLRLYTGSNSREQLELLSVLRAGSKLTRMQVLNILREEKRVSASDFSNYSLLLAPEYVQYFLEGTPPRPDFGSDFPATLIESQLAWEDLVLPETVWRQIKRVMHWVEYGPALLQADRWKINPSFPVLFYGSPGTGKTLTAKLIGKYTGKLVFRVDLSTVVSKYIGETEKNLAILFDRAQGKDWILFFDEADALFGKRTDIKDSNDKWANLELSFLLQRIEEYSGLVILASNLKDNIDKALTRRFQAIVEFPRPDKNAQVKLWEKLLPRGFSYAANVDLPSLCKYSFSGANIANVLKIGCLETLAEGERELTNELLRRVIREELAKENRTT